MARKDSLMDYDDPEKRVAELESGRHALANDGPLTTQQVRSIVFSKATVGQRGYNADEVDAFRDRVEAALLDPTGRPLTAEQVGSVAFSQPRGGQRGYNQGEVDAFLDRVQGHLGQPAHLGDPQLRPVPLPVADSGDDVLPVETRSKRRVWMAVAAIGFLGLSLVFFGLAGRDYVAYRNGTPATAKVEHCALPVRHLASSRSHDDIIGKIAHTQQCTVTWSLDGVPHTGKTKVFRHYGDREPTSVDVRVQGGTAYTVAVAVDNVIMGVLVLAVGAVAVFFIWTGRHLSRIVGGLFDD
jgi:DivIVA domain-containing protein